jgi:NAD-dependent SIR2 family protein deacetylase
VLDDALATADYRAIAEPAEVGGLEGLAELVRGGGVVVLSGAGLSTESGIPDYRGPSGALRHRLPMSYQEFVGSRTARQRYWARSHLGWRTVARAQPNAGHRAVAVLQSAGPVGGVITQNVDGLHQAAGARDVVELHGSLDRVVCLDCRECSDREQLDHRMRAANPGFDADAVEVKPDGDVELAAGVVAEFELVPCTGCGSDRLKPDVVFFGENVPADRVHHCYHLVGSARALLVLGSSLTVMSGYRFVRYAAKHGIPVAIVNQGTTRGDAEACLRLDAPLGATLTELTHLVGRQVTR